LDSKTGELLTQAQKDTLKEFIEKNFSGAVNSGKTLVSPIPLKVEDLQIALKDMDFKDLYDRATESVYRALNIPLPLINNEHTSMNNMDVSTLMFFDDGVLPQLDNFCENIFAFVISQRYKDGSDFLRLSYNPNSIAALQPRIAQVIKLQKEAGVSTINELRQNLGLGRIDSEGCDDIYLPGTLVPVGRDTNLRDAIGMDAPDTTDRDGKKWLEKQMRESKQANGEPLYSEKAISILTA
jgi:phage portal protein BeeE